MIKSEVKEAVLKQIELIPDWDECKNLSANDIRQAIMPKLDFKEIRDWLQFSWSNKLNFTMSEIGEKWYEFILFWVLEQEDDDTHFFSNAQLLEDDFRHNKMTAMDKWYQISENWEVQNIQSMSLEKFLELSKVPF